MIWFTAVVEDSGWFRVENAQFQRTTGLEIADANFLAQSTFQLLLLFRGVVCYDRQFQEKKWVFKESYVGGQTVELYCNCEMEVKGKLVAGGAQKAERKAHEIKCYVWDLWNTWSKEHYKYSGWKRLDSKWSK